MKGEASTTPPAPNAAPARVSASAKPEASAPAQPKPCPIVRPAFLADVAALIIAGAVIAGAFGVLEAQKRWVLSEQQLCVDRLVVANSPPARFVPQVVNGWTRSSESQ